MVGTFFFVRPKKLSVVPTKNMPRHHMVRHRHHKRKHHHAASTVFGRTGGIVNLRGPSGWFPPRTVVRSTIQSDWAGFPAIGIAGVYSYRVKINSIWQPLVGFSAAPGITYTGLSTLMNSAGGFTNSIYRLARVTWSKITVEVNRATAPVNSIECAVYPNADGALATTLPVQIANMPNAVVRTYMNDSTAPTKLVRSIIPRKMLGLSREQYGDSGFYADDISDPVVVRQWVVSFKPCNGAAEAAGTYVHRVKLDALIELSDPWDANLNIPV